MDTRPEAVMRVRLAADMPERLAVIAAERLVDTVAALPAGDSVAAEPAAVAVDLPAVAAVAAMAAAATGKSWGVPQSPRSCGLLRKARPLRRMGFLILDLEK
jgi:hypothetical protein